MSCRTLVFIPTYNERGNAPEMCAQLNALGLDADILFVDDNSPDGTGEILESLKEKFPRLIVSHRPGKLGIGSAHLDGINWAYDRGYDRLVTMDCDFTHSPADIPRLVTAAGGYDIVVGSRFLRQGSLPGWSRWRKGMTATGHFLTKTLLGLPQDASGAFRVYELARIPREAFAPISARGYAFFFESLFVLAQAGFKINEVPIVLPSRIEGHLENVAHGNGVKGVARLFLVAFSSRMRRRPRTPGH